MTDTTTTEQAGPTQAELAGLFQQFSQPTEAAPEAETASEATPEGAGANQEAPETEAVAETEAETEIETGAEADAGEAEAAASGSEAEAETETEAELQFEPPAAPVVAPPAGMTATEVQAFQALSPEMQRYVAFQEQQRNTDYQRRTNELADERAQAEALRTQYGERLQQQIDVLEAQTQKVPEPPPSSLRDEDFDAYERQRDDYIVALHQRQERQAKLDGLRQERDAELARQQDATNAARAQHLAEQWAELPTRVPEAADPAKLAIIQKDVQSYASEKGYTPAELAEIRAVDFQMLYQSMLYERAVASAGKAKAKPRPKAPKSQQPGTSKPIAQASDKRFQAAKQAFDTQPDRNSLAGMFLATRGSG